MRSAATLGCARARPATPCRPVVAAPRSTATREWAQVRPATASTLAVAAPGSAATRVSPLARCVTASLSAVSGVSRNATGAKAQGLFPARAITGRNDGSSGVRGGNSASRRNGLEEEAEERGTALDELVSTKSISTKIAQGEVATWRRPDRHFVFIFAC